MQVELSLSLLEGISANVIATAVTDSKGRFSFAETIAPGLYFLELNPSDLRSRWSGEALEGLMAIEVRQDAKEDGLDLDLGWSDCGLSHAQHKVYPELKIGKVCGNIADAMGAEIPNADVVLMASQEGGKIVDETGSGAKGRFDLGVQHEG